MFFQHKFETKIKSYGKGPVISISPEAFETMWYIVDACKEEVGWLAEVQKQGNVYFINDVYLPEQQVHSATTELTPEGLAKLANELMAKADGLDRWNRMQMWGHSHVNMGTSPSGQDDKQMKMFKDSGYPWFIRLICNKNGRMEFTLFDYENEFEYDDVPWCVGYTATQGLKERIKQLVDAVVKPFTYQSTGGGWGGYERKTLTIDGVQVEQTANGAWIGHTFIRNDEITTAGGLENIIKKFLKKDVDGSGSKAQKGKRSIEVRLSDEESVFAYMDYHDLQAVYHLDKWIDVRDYIVAVISEEHTEGDDVPHVTVSWDTVDYVIKLAKGYFGIDVKV